MFIKFDLNLQPQPDYVTSKMKKQTYKGRKALIAVALAVAVAMMYSCSQRAEASDGLSDFDRNTRAMKVSRFGHSYVYLSYYYGRGGTFSP